MDLKKPKKLIIINILDILRKYSDEDHRLSQKDIADILRREYGMAVDRKAIKRNIVTLMECGYDIEYTESVRVSPVIDSKTKKQKTDPKTGEPMFCENSILSDFYLVRDFTDGELRLLIDTLLYSKHIPFNHCRELIEKLEGLSTTHFRSRMKHIRVMDAVSPANPQLFYTIEALDEAITKKRKVTFLYNKYGTDKKLHPITESNGTAKEYLINPYQIAVSSGKYYLICNYDKYDSLSNYRIDRITDIKITDEPVKPMNKLDECKNGFDLPRHMAEHIYMFAGNSDIVTFKFQKYFLNEVIDWFGNAVNFINEDELEITAKVKVNIPAMCRWAVQNATNVRVLSPDILVEMIREDIKAAMYSYNIPNFL